ncbi:MAG TPA: sulfotransferase [Phycisphaerales bacterium]|nr:sulfotransferase [Phycisphaerales bacterium]
MTAIQYNALVQRAQRLLNERRHIDCRAVCQELLHLRKNDPQALLILAQLEANEGRRSDAIRQLQKFVQLYPKDINARLMLGGYLVDAGRTREGLTQFEKVLKTVPGHLEALRCSAIAHERGGDVNKALELLEPYIAARTANAGMALEYVTAEMNRKNFARAIEVGLPYALHAGGDLRAEEALWYVLGQSFEKLGEIDKAFDAYSRANSVNAPPYDPDAHDREIDALIEVFSKDNLAKMPRATHGDTRPVFIACRPRSGSTLLDRILGSHPAVHATGENNTLARLITDMQLLVGSTRDYPQCALDMDVNDTNEIAKRYIEYLDSVAPAAGTRITNKRLGNWRYLGLISLLFPQTRIIDLRRDRVDNTLACWMINLGSAFPFSYSLEHLGRAQRTYERLMDHWHNVLSVPILKVNYEDIVDDQEGWSRKILDFLGLDWSESVLRFHEVGEKKGSDVPTLSYAQVRQPIYKTSVGRAKKFEKHIKPLLDALGEE